MASIGYEPEDPYSIEIAERFNPMPDIMRMNSVAG